MLLYKCYFTLQERAISKYGQAKQKTVTEVTGTQPQAARRINQISIFTNNKLRQYAAYPKYN